jgi:hypothetical protein
MKKVNSYAIILGGSKGQLRIPPLSNFPGTLPTSYIYPKSVNSCQLCSLAGESLCSFFLLNKACTDMLSFLRLSFYAFFKSTKSSWNFFNKDLDLTFLKVVNLVLCTDTIISEILFYLKRKIQSKKKVYIHPHPPPHTHISLVSFIIQLFIVLQIF